jgi:hypothetical protein
MQAGTQTDRQTDGRTDRQTYRQTGRQTDRDRQTDGQTLTYAGMQTGGLERTQTGIHMRTISNSLTHTH